MTIINDYPFMPLKEAPKNYGWICPECGAVMSPSTPWCYFCNGKSKEAVDSTSIDHYTEEQKKKI